MRNLRVVSWTSVLIFLCALLPMHALAQDIPVGEVDVLAVAVVENYLLSLINGDIPGIKNTLTESLLQEKSPTLDSAGYDATLRELYAGTSFSIVKARWIAVEQARVEAEILYSDGRTMTAAFVVARTQNNIFLIDQELK